MKWIILIIAGLFEVAWAYSMKQSVGFTKAGPTISTAIAMFISCALLAWAMRSLPLGTAYMVWTGIGAVGAFLVGIIVLGEPSSATRLIAAFLIVSGLVLMRLATPA